MWKSHLQPHHNPFRHWTSLKLLLSLSITLPTQKSLCLSLLSIVPFPSACEVPMVVPLPLSYCVSVLYHCEVLLSIEVISLVSSFLLSLPLPLLFNLCYVPEYGARWQHLIVSLFSFLGTLSKKTQRLLITCNILKC